MIFSPTRLVQGIRRLSSLRSSSSILPPTIARSAIFRVPFRNLSNNKHQQQENKHNNNNNHHPSHHHHPSSSHDSRSHFVSHVKGDKVGLLHLTVHELLERAAAVAPMQHPALIVDHQNIKMTYTELLHECRRFARNLQRYGFQKGDRFGVWAPNIFEWTVAQFATSYLGVILVNINPNYRRHELQHALNLAGVKGLMVARCTQYLDPFAILEELCPSPNARRVGAWDSSAVPSLRFVMSANEQTEHHGVLSYREFMRHDTSFDPPTPSSPPHPSDPINIQFTSGTTGSPKGATLTHVNIVNNGYFIAQTLKYSDSDSICIPVPLYHCFGMVIGNLAAVSSAATMVYPSLTFSPSHVMASVTKNKCTSLYGVPTMFLSILQLNNLGDFDVSSLRTGVVAGSVCSEETMKAILKHLGISQITNCYGLTEVSPVCFQTKLGTSFEKKIKSVGVIHPNVESKLIDREGEVVRVGQKGEVLVRGYSVMFGYWGDDAKTREMIDQQGWLHTGDLGTMDEDGYLSIVGRIKDVIIRGGENIFPAEIENIIQKHEAVGGVAVVGVPHPLYGEEVCAWVELKDSSKELSEDEQLAMADVLRAHCSENMAHFKVPRFFLFVKSFPMTVTGKIQKNIMRQQSVKMIQESMYTG